MTDDFGRLFGALAIQRGLVSPQQVVSLLKRVDESQPLDVQMVRAGWVTATGRLEILSEMDSQVLAASGNVESAVRAAGSQSAEVDEFISLYDSSVRSAKKNSPSASDGAARFEQTLVRSGTREFNDATGEFSDADATSAPAGKPAGPSDDEFSATVISHISSESEDKTDADASRPFDGTLIYQAESQPEKEVEKEKARKKSDGDSDSEFGATVDYKPEYHSRYTLTQVYGEGGLGQVWLATDPALNREIALKRIRPGKDGSRDAQLRLIKEAQITGQLEHPNIIPVYELEHADNKGRPFYTMKFLRGKTLHEKIQEYHKKRKAGEDDALDLVNLLNAFTDMCYAIAYAGARGVIHRDLKPQNIMVGDFGEVLVLDWGLAKKIGQPDDVHEKGEIELASVLDETETHAGGVIGTPAYMAPEQAAGRNDHVDARTDVYGLGGVLFCILAGVSPHRGSRTKNRIKDTQDLLTRISIGATPSVRDLDPRIPRSLDAICAKAMSHSHLERYQDARQLAEDVQRYIADEPVSVSTESWQERAGRWLRKNRVWAQSLATSALLVMVVAVAAALVVNSARNSEIVAHGKTQNALEAEAEAKAAAEQAQKEATQFFLASRRTVDTLYRELSDSLSEYPAVQSLRVKLLEEAATEYERLAETRSEVPELKLEAARSLVRLGEVWRLLRNFERATDSFGKAQTQLAEIVKLDSSNSVAATELVTCLNGQGLTWATTAPLERAEDGADPVARADEFYREALKVVKSLIEKVKQDESEVDMLLRQLKARVLANRGSLLGGTDRLDDSLHCLTDAEADFRAIAESDASSEKLHEHLKSLVELSRILLLNGQTDEARSKLEEAIQVFSRLVAANPDDTRFMSGRADARLSLANALSGDDVLSVRLGVYQECVADYLLLIQSRPDVPLYRSSLVAAETNIAQVLYQQGETKTAGDHAYAALEQVQLVVDADAASAHAHSLDVYVRVTYGQILRDSGEFTDAESAFTSALEKCVELTTALPDDANLWRLQSETKNNLGILYLTTERGELAQQVFASAREDFKKTQDISPDLVAAVNGHAWASSYLGDALRGSDREAEAPAMYDEALALRSPLTSGGNVPSFDVGEAAVWLLTNCPDDSKRDYVVAMKLAEALVAKYPKSGRGRVLLAMCHYRQANYEVALSELDEAKLYNLGNRTSAYILRAMTLWKLDENVKAEAAWKQAVGIMDSHTPGYLRLRRLRAEAEALLGDVAKPAADAQSL
ncbi:MAG: serine/threonine protein kinase/Flp pilus assembly protein TadD [Planctomycetaceae bacterium]|jgi:serine/threonine protein kinase/Flp pilus assembly protein TadD